MSIKEIYPPLTEREIKGAAVARMAAAESMVLMKNDGMLPLNKEKPVALFGNGAIRTIRGGTGSGDPFNGGLSGGGDADVDLSPRYHIHIMDAMLAEGFKVVNEAQLNNYAKAYDQAKLDLNAGPMQVFTFPEEELKEEDIKAYAAQTDVAVLVISRNCGEGNDRKEEGNFKLSEVELANMKLIRDNFAHMAVVLNIPGPISGTDLQSGSPDAILLMGQSGQEGGAALTDVITGAVNPSGHLTDTWAFDYKDIPSSDTYLSDWDTSLYEEGIFVGYRYFDTFNVTPAYHFGFGLSYTTFAVETLSAVLEGTSLKAEVKVTNTGDRAGKQVVQLYVSAPESELEMPYQELRGFEKTGLLQPGEAETLTITVPLADMASYSENHGGYILSKGDYVVRIGVASNETDEVCLLRVAETHVTKMVYVELPLAQELNELKKNENCRKVTVSPETPVLEVKELPETRDCRSVYHDQAVTTYSTDPDYKAVMPYEKVVYVEKKDWTYEDLKAGRCTDEEFLAQLSEEQLANFVCGTGWGVEDDANPVVGGSSESVPGAAGETTHALTEKYGVPSIVMADGPGGVRLTQHFMATNVETGEKQEVFHHCIAWPVGSVIARSFDREVMREVGRAMCADLEAFRIAILLGPGINIHRNPLCGRNFEYFSEDPLVAGEMAAYATLGIQEKGTAGACIKHYAANSQETNRNANDSVVGQRALREIYLEPFRIAVEKAQPWSIMTSYNKINSVPSADSYDLCTDLTRGEWGFKGLIMTDWNGGSSTPSISMHAGNDLIMPGGKMRELNILQAVKNMDPEFDERGEVAKISIFPGAPIYSLSWFSFTPAAGGADTVEAKIGEGHSAEVKDGMILVDGEPVYTQAGAMRDAMRDRANFKPLLAPATTDFAELSEDKKSIIYHGNRSTVKTICLGDIQLRAKYNLDVIRLYQ